MHHFARKNFLHGWGHGTRGDLEDSLGCAAPNALVNLLYRLGDPKCRVPCHHGRNYPPRELDHFLIDQFHAYAYVFELIDNQEVVLDQDQLLRTLWPHIG